VGEHDHAEGVVVDAVSRTGGETAHATRAENPDPRRAVEGRAPSTVYEAPQRRLTQSSARSMPVTGWKT
jgi:hypothetical protein